MNATAAAAPTLRLPAPFLPALRRALAQGRSAVEAATLLRQVGYESGEAFHAALEEQLAAGRGGASPDTLPPEEFWSAFGRFWEEMGWGTVRHVQLHPGVGALDASDWVEAEGEAGGHPACHFTTGVLADVLSRVAGSEVAVMEVECRAAGDGRCRFLFGGVGALGEVYRGMTEGLSYSDALERLG